MDTVGAHKILWGTDYPLRIFPRTQKEPDMATFRDLIEEEAGLTHEEQAQVLGANLLSLLPC
jgi:predicted TIM-barrel fold metal-dependent hydrolase